MSGWEKVRLREYAQARDKLRASVAPVENMIAACEAAIAELRLQVRTLEEMRPMWAQGFTSDSEAAQANGNALSEIWTLLGAVNQTEAMAKLRALVGE